MNELFPGCYLRKTRETSDGGDEDDTDDDDDNNDNDDNDNYNDNDDTDGDTDAPNVYFEKSQGLRRKFFREFSDDEVAEIYQVHNFMMFVSSRVRCATAGLPWMHTRASLTLFQLRPWIPNLH